MGYVIATVNMKGGVGKTTLTVNLATCLAKNHGKRVLIVDLDTQINATLSLMSPADFAKLRAEKRTLRRLVHKAIQFDRQLPGLVPEAVRPYICNIKGLDLLPGDIDLYDEFLVSEMLHRKAMYAGQDSFEQVWNNLEQELVKSILQAVSKDYDFVVLDCAPGYNLLTRSALLASNFYILPAKAEPLSLIGIQLLERRLAKLRESHATISNPVVIQLLGIVFTMSGNLLASRYHKQVMRRVHNDFSEDKIFKTQIPVDMNVSKAVDSFMPVVLTHANSSGSKAFSRLTQELLQKLEMAVGAKSQKTKLSLTDLE